MAYDGKLAERLHDVLKGTKGLVSKRMFGGLCFMLDGKMLCGVLKDNLVLKYDASHQAKVMAMPHVKPFDFTKKPMAGIAYVTPPGTKTAASIKKWVKLAQTLRKPAKKT